MDYYNKEFRKNKGNMKERQKNINKVLNKNTHDNYIKEILSG